MTEQISDISDLNRGLKKNDQNWPWTRRQLLGLSSDVITVKATTRLIDPIKWELLGQSETFIWGHYSRQSLPPHKIFIRMADLTGECSCTATKHPCKFLIALLVLNAMQPDLFTFEKTPDWVNETVASRVDAKNSKPPKPVNLTQIKAGMAEFGRWLRDQVRQGVANFAERKAADLETMANRLIDAHAIPIANELRTLGKTITPHKGNPPDDWPEILLKGLGRFYLLVQAWDRFDQLSPAEQNDLIQATVFISGRARLNIEPALTAETVEDQWVVLGRRTDGINRKWSRRVWLYGSKSKRFALLEDEVSGRHKFLSHLVTGVVYSGSIQFEAGTTRFAGKFLSVGDDESRTNLAPKRIVVSRPRRPLHEITQSASFSEIEKEYVQALTQNPWLPVWPVYLNAVRLNYDKQVNQWLVLDGQGHSIPVQNGKDNGWYLLAGSQGRPIDLFGELKNDAFNLVSVFYDGAWLDLTVWGSRS